MSRNILKLLADQRSRVLGSRLRSRMLIGAVLLSFAPALFMFLFSYLLMNRSIERWFSQPVSQLREDSTRVASELAQYATANAQAEAESLASSEDLNHALQPGSAQRSFASCAPTASALRADSLVYRDGKYSADYQRAQRSEGHRNSFVDRRKRRRQTACRSQNS